MFRSKSKKVKNDLKLNVMFTLFIQFYLKIIFPNYLPFNLITFEIKILTRSNPQYEVGFCFFWPLAGSHFLELSSLSIKKELRYSYRYRNLDIDTYRYWVKQELLFSSSRSTSWRFQTKPPYSRTVCTRPFKLLQLQLYISVTQ